MTVLSYVSFSEIPQSFSELERMESIIFAISSSHIKTQFDFL